MGGICNSVAWTHHAEDSVGAHQMLYRIIKIV